MQVNIYLKNYYLDCLTLSFTDWVAISAKKRNLSLSWDTQFFFRMKPILSAIKVNIYIKAYYLAWFLLLGIWLPNL